MNLWFVQWIGKPDKDKEHSWQVLGGSKDFPYPQQDRRGRPPTETGWLLINTIGFNTSTYIRSTIQLKNSNFVGVMTDPASENRLSIYDSSLN